MAASNHERLDAYVDAGLRRAAVLGRPEAIALLRANAEVVRRHLAILERWAARGDAHPCPVHLQGLSAFDLSDAAERLEAAAARLETAGAQAEA